MKPSSYSDRPLPIPRPRLKSRRFFAPARCPASREPTRPRIRARRRSEPPTRWDHAGNGAHPSARAVGDGVPRGRAVRARSRRKMRLCVRHRLGSLIQLGRPSAGSRRMASEPIPHGLLQRMTSPSSFAILTCLCRMYDTLAPAASGCETIAWAFARWHMHDGSVSGSVGYRRRTAGP
jgi:hypothetical protein